MSNLIEQLTIWISYSDGIWDNLQLTVYPFIGITTIFVSKNVQGRNEDETVSDLVNRFAKEFNSENLRRKVIQEFRRLRENDFSSAVWRKYIVYVAPENQLEHHFSCKKTSNEDSTILAQEENRMSKSELKQQLENLNKDSEIMKFFVENKCFVCLSSYKEITDDNLHIVIPTCGHPLCCQCADNILVSDKRECPRCRGNITADSFDLMKFNADLEVDSQDQKVFL